MSGRVRASWRRCDILNLVLGPLDLDLLGLEVHLNRVILNIVAVSGAGNLSATCSAPWPGCWTTAACSARSVRS